MSAFKLGKVYGGHWEWTSADDVVHPHVPSPVVKFYVDRPKHSSYWWRNILSDTELWQGTEYGAWYLGSFDDLVDICYRTPVIRTGLQWTVSEAIEHVTGEEVTYDPHSCLDESYCLGWWGKMMVENHQDSQRAMRQELRTLKPAHNGGRFSYYYVSDVIDIAHGHGWKLGAGGIYPSAFDDLKCSVCHVLMRSVVDEYGWIPTRAPFKCRKGCYPRDNYNREEQDLFVELHREQYARNCSQDCHTTAVARITREVNLLRSKRKWLRKEKEKLRLVKQHLRQRRQGAEQSQRTG